MDSGQELFTNLERALARKLADATPHTAWDAQLFDVHDAQGIVDGLVLHICRAGHQFPRAQLLLPDPSFDRDVSWVHHHTDRIVTFLATALAAHN
jgi:hypothetical protein